MNDQFNYSTSGKSMNSVRSILDRKNNVKNVNVDKNINNNVYDDVASKIRTAIDKPKAIGEILAERLNAPRNTKFYIKLAYQYSQEILFECLSLTDEAARENRIRTTKPQYFWGIVRRKK